MKARTVNAPKLIAAYGVEGEKLAALRVVCDTEGVALRIIEPARAGCRIGFLCGFGGFEPAPDCAEPPAAECLIFSGFDRASLTRTVDLLRRSGAGVELKAVCTPTNQSWTLIDLLTELAKEHEYMTKRGGAE